MKETKPSTFTEHPWNSACQNCECEIVAANVMRILKRTGDTFRPLSPKEYVKERKKDGSYTVKELGYFEKVIKYCKNADTAALFSPTWEKAAIAKTEVKP